MRKYSIVMMTFALLLTMAQCKKEPATPNNGNAEIIKITLNVDNDDSTPSAGLGAGERLTIYPSTGAVIFTDGDKIYVGNNGKYVGTLTFESGLFQGTVSGDLSTNDYLHFYFVGNKPTSPANLTASTTTYTVDISDQSTGLPAISYAPSTAKYSPSTTAYTARLLNKSALVKFVPSEATALPITVSGLKNEVQIDFANHTLAPSGTTGGITLYSVSDTEKWAVLLAQEAVSDATVTIRGYDARASLPPITNNMYYNSGVGISMTAAYVTYEANNSNWESVLASFNAEPSPNPMLELTGNITIGNTGFAITRADGTIDLKGYTLGTTYATHALFLQNNVLDKSLTIMNGTINAPVDGNVGWTDWYCGTVIFEDITFKREVFFDGHLCELTNVNFAAGSMFENYTGGSGNPGLVIINSGKFNCAFHANEDHATKGLTTIYGGKFSTNPSSIANVIIPEGYSIKSNTDSDSGTYPWVVTALPEGALRGEFTINGSGDKVYFSKGNLQYIGSAATPYWKFADNQWDVLGTTTDQTSSDQNVDRDLFGWGTSGWNNGNTYYHPWDTDRINSNLYGPPGLYDLTGTYANADWGVYNSISNGGNQANQWRTLTQPEWAYVFNSRTGAASKWGHGNVKGVNGMILLPDDWTLPEGLSFTSGNSRWANVYNAEQWAQMEANGAVFLPAAGWRSASVRDVGVIGGYWSASYYSSSDAYFVYFYDSNLNLQLSNYRYLGFSVRLVRSAQ